MSTRPQRASLVALGTIVGLFGAFSVRPSPGSSILSSLKSPATTTTTAPTSSGPATTPTTTPTTTPAVKSGVATGAVVNYYFGTLSVQVTVAGGKITKVTTGSLNDGGNPRSAQIDQYSLPILEQEVVTAQSANIQSVSGASYTSAGFAQSLQGALTKLGL